MKFLVLAFDAQSGADVGVKEDGAARNGMWTPTPLPWRPKCVGKALVRLENYGLGCKPVCGECWVQRSLP